MEALQPRAEGLPAKRPPPPDFFKKSFAQMFATAPQQQPLEFPLSVHKGEVAIKIPAAAIDKLAIPFKHALVGKFSHGRPSLEETRKALSKLDFKGALEVGLIDYRHVLLRFYSEADFHRIWTRGIWQIGKYPMRVFKWSPSFQTSKETSIVPVWFELPGLPCHLFDHGVLFSIMKAVGVPLSIDAATLNLARPSVARVNVEIDLMRDLPSRIWIEHGDDGEGFWQRINPENLPLYCNSCFRQCHSHEGCNMHENRVQKTWKPKAPKVVTPNPPNTVAASVSKLLLLENEVQGAAPNGKQNEQGAASRGKQKVANDLDEILSFPVSGHQNASTNLEGILLSGQQNVSTNLEGILLSGQHVGSTKLDGILASASKSLEGHTNTQQHVSTILEENLSLSLSGQQMGPKELDEVLFLASNSLESHAITKVSAQKIIDWDHVFQTISGNILNCKDGFYENVSAHTHVPHPILLDTLFPNHVNVGEDIILKEDVMISEIICLDSNATPECPLFDDAEVKEMGLENFHTFGQVEGQDNARDKRDDIGLQSKSGIEGEIYAGLNKAWHNLVSSNNAPGEFVEFDQMGEAFHSGRDGSSEEAEATDQALIVTEGEPLDYDGKNVGQSVANQNGDDRWTENSFEDESEDELGKFLEKMEKGRKQSKQTKYIEALVSPKASDLSGRKLRPRNPLHNYTQAKKWSHW